MDKVYELTIQLARVGSRIEKERLIREFPQQDTLKEVLRLTYDPFITYGITDFTESIGYSGADLIQTLNRCASRELSGGAARSALGSALVGANPNLRHLVRNILNKDLRCGVSEKTVLKLYPGLIQVFDVMRAEKYEPSSDEVYAEPKYDGLRCVGIVRGQSVILLSRNGKEFTAADHIKPVLLSMASELGDRVFDGELVAPGGFNASVSSVKRKSSNGNPAIYHCFEVIPMAEWGTTGLVYEERRKRMESVCSPHTHFSVVPSFKISEDQVRNKYLQFLNEGLEGAIIKKAKGLYRMRRHTDWMKLKEVCDVDSRVVRLIEGEGRLKGSLGAAVILYNGKEVNVGSGWSDKERSHYWMYKSQLIGKTIEVQYHQETPDGSLRHPRFIKMRPDKD